MTNNTVLLEEKEDVWTSEFWARFLLLTIVIFILCTYLGLFQWNKNTGLIKVIKAFVQFIFSIIIGYIVSVVAWLFNLGPFHWFHPLPFYL